MTSTHDLATLDREIRAFIYDRLISGGRVPLAREVAGHFGLPVEDVHSAFRRMKDAHILVLQEGEQEVLMANPFSAVPTPFLVEIGTNSWWGNCVWDALGVAAMVKGDARITTVCG